jgi:hypothetical protein
MESIKGIFINAKIQEVEEIEFPVRYGEEMESVMNNLRQMLDCELPVIGKVLRFNDVIWIDSETALNNQDYGFILKGKSYIGNGVILGTDINNESCDMTASPFDIEESVLFINGDLLKRVNEKNDI